MSAPTVQRDCPSMLGGAGRPTLDEVVYNHIDIKMHPLLVQLDGNMIAALTKFFKVQKTGADVGEKRLDKAMGLSVIARAGVHLPRDR